MSIRCLDNKTGLPLCAEERLAIETYDEECDRGLLHNETYAKLMEQFRALRAEQENKCPGGSISPRDPNFDEDHVFVNGICAQCRMRVGEG